MDSGTSLGKRVSREGERRTMEIQVPGEKEGITGVGGKEGIEELASKPGFNRRQSWNKEDLKRVMSEKLMIGEGEGDENAGYVSKS